MQQESGERVASLLHIKENKLKTFVKVTTEKTTIIKDACRCLKTSRQNQRAGVFIQRRIYSIMWDKEATKTSKNDDTPAEGIPELTTGCTKINDLTKNAAVESDTLVVATCVVNDDGDSAENSDTVECPTETEPSDINRLLSVVRLNDGPSTSAQRNELNKIQNSTLESNVTPNTTNASLQKSVSTTATAGCTVIKDITNFSALTVTTDCDELPYTSTNANVKTHAFQQSPKPIISVKYFSPIVRAQNETVVSPISGTIENRRDTNFQKDIVAGPQIQNSNDNPVCLPETDSDTVSRVPSPASQIRALSPANSSVTSMSTPRSAKNTRGRRVVCLRHMRRAPKEPEEYIDALFPHIREAHNQIRGALLHAPLTDVKDNVLLKRKILDVIRHYVSGCKNEFERVGASVILCRRLKRNIFRLLDLFHEICSSSREDPVYLYHISQLIAVYNSLEIRLSFNLTKLQKCALIHRISHVIHKHLMVKDELLAKGNILRMFLHMPDMYSARFIMEPLFNTFLVEIPTTSNNCCQRELPDKAFVQYIIVLHLWKEMLRDPLEQVELINRAQHFMCPTKTLHTNPLYANHLPTIHTRKNAVKDILNSLKFFHDLKNAAICGDILQDEDDDIEVVIDDVINKPFWDFGATYTSETKHQRTVNLGVSTPEPVECVDLTEEDDQQPIIEHVEYNLDWLAELKERASERVHADETENIICLDSDSDGELFSGSIVDPTESYQDCFGVDTDYTSLDSSSTDDKVASEDDVSPTSVLSPNGIRTYLAPKSKKQINSSDDNRLNTNRPQARTESSHARLRDDDDRVTLSTKTSALSREGTLPLIVNTFTVSNKQNMHFLGSPRLSLDIGPERFGGEDMELPHTGDNERETRKIAMQQQSRETAKDQGDGYYENDNDNDNDDEDEYHSLPSTSSSTTTNLGKVIYSQALPHLNRRLLPKDDVQAVRHSHVGFKGKDGVKQGYKQNNEAGTKQVHTHVAHKPVKKQVKFNDNPIGPTRCPQTKLPIKPAIHLNKIPNNNQHQQPILSSSPQPRFASPSSSTSSTAESLKQMAQKEHINAIATLFSSYQITKPSLVKSAPAHNSGSSTTLENSKTAEKPTHNSRKKSTLLKSRRSAPMSPHSVSSSRNHSILPTSLRENSPIITDAEVAADPKLNMKCAVVLQENEEVLKYKKQEIAFINDLLEKQREMQRQRALKRQELQNILKKKCDEGKRLMVEITEIKRQRAEAQEKSLLAQQKQQSTNISNRKRVLVRDRKIKLKAKTTTTTTRSATPPRMVGGQGDAKTTENEIDKSVAEAVQATKGDSLEVAANVKSLIDVVAAITDTSVEKLVTTTQMPAEIGNDLTEAIPQSPKERAQSPSNVSEDSANANANFAIELPTASSSIKTQVMDIDSKALQSTGDFAANKDEEVPKAKRVPMKKSANKKSLSEKPKLPIVKGKLTPATHIRCVRSMTPPATKTTVSSTQTPLDIEPTRQNALLKSSLSFSSPKSSRTHLFRAPSLSPSIFMPRNRVDVRQSMRDHSSNTDFPSSTKSWFLHASARTFTKTLKVRLKRLQHLNMSTSPSYLAEKNDNNKSARPASTIPVFSNKSVTNVVQLEDAIKRIEEPKLSILELSPSKTERVQKLKQRLKSQLLEMDEKYGATVTKVIENVLINTSREVTPNPPSSTAEIRSKKAVRRKAQRKQTQHSKKLKLSGKATSEYKESKRQLEITSSKSDDKKQSETENGAQCDSDRIEIDNTTANKMAENESKETDSSAIENTAEEGVNCRQENCAKEQEAPEEPTKKDQHELVDEVAISICKETSANVAMDIDDDTNTVDEKLRSKLVHDGTTTVDEKLRNKLAHGAIVTQVVDVTPGRLVNDSLLGEILVVKATPTSAVLNNIEEPKIESKASNVQAADADIASSAEKSVEEHCSTPASPASEDAINKAPTGISNEMAAADTSLAMLANTRTKPQTTPNIIPKELQNENSESLIATSVILSKISSCDSISSNLEIVPDPPTSIGLQNDSHSRSIMPIGDNTSENAKPTVAENHENRNEFVRLQVSTSSLCGDEDSSSDCLLSHLSKQVRKMSDLDGIVDASTGHVIKDATMTLMSFEATPTLPTYLLNGESRDVPTPPAISTPAPTPLPILTTEGISDTEQQSHTATPTSALLEPAKSELTLTPAQEPKENKSDRLQKSDFQMGTTSSEKEREQVPEKNIPTVALPMLVEQELEKLGGKPLLENTINSTASGSAISTSDHEVSSTQELIYIPSTKRSNSNTLNNSLDVATPTLVEETTMVVQNSQIDTTHHLPENSYYMRRRARKFSDEFTLRENKGDNTVTKVALKQRRKTFSSESSLHVQFAPNTLFTTNENTLISSRSTTSGSTSSGLKSGGGGSGGSSPSTTTEPVIKHTHQTRRRNHIQKSRNKTQSPLTGRSRGGGGVSELNSTFVFGCSRLQTSKSDMADSERCVVIPASAVVPPVNLGIISHAYTKKTMSQIKVFVPPEGEMCLENEGSEKNLIKRTSKISGTEATTTSRRGRRPGSLNKKSKKPKLSESAEKTKANKTAVNSSKGKTTTARTTNKRSNKNEREQLVNSAKPLPAPTTAKAPARTKNADRASNRRRK